MSQSADSATDGSDAPTDAALVTHLQSLAARLGKTPTVVDLADDEDCPFAPEDYIETFGDWNSALEEAGLDPNGATTKIPDHELLGELQRLYKKRGSPPTRAEMREYGKYSDKVYQHRFGSWNDALQAAMLDTNDLSEDQLLNELERVAHELDCIPTADEMREHGEHRPVTYHRRFGSWRAALAAADFSDP